MTSSDIVATRLTATRITDTPGPLGTEMAVHYRAWHAELTERLATRFTSLEPADLFVTCTANAESELLIGAHGRTIVHDQHLGRTLNRMTLFVVGEWPASRVQAWAFERLATAALVRGDYESSQLALGLHASLVQADDAPRNSEETMAAKSLIVTIQEFFVLAHEVAHTALGNTTHEQLEAHLSDDLDVVYAKAKDTEIDLNSEIDRQWKTDLTVAIKRHLGTDETPTEEDLSRLDPIEKPEPLDERDWLRSHKYMYEELACDLIATELTVDHFRDLHDAIELRTVLPAILLALHNLTTLEYLRSIGDDRTDDIQETLVAAMIRKSVWRNMTRRMYQDQSPYSLAEYYVQITEEHAHYLGDQVLFIVPTTWTMLLKEIGKRDGKLEVDETELMGLRSLVWSFAKMT